MKSKILLIAIIAVMMSGCRKDMPDMQNPRTDVHITNWYQWFDSYWNGMNYNYNFWDIDPTDWDEVYRTYGPRFEELKDKGFDDKEVNEAAFDMVKEMSASLVDGHFAVMAYMGEDTYAFSPITAQVEKRDNYHTSEDTWKGKVQSIEKMDEEGRFTEVLKGSVTEADGGNTTALAGVLDGDIIYFTFNQFMLYVHTLSDEEDAISLVLKQYHDLLDSYPDVKGVIVDVRSNGGGALLDLPLVLGKFVKEDHTFCYQHYKKGIGRLDFSPWIPGKLEAIGSMRTLDVPIVVLADMQSVSMAEMTTLAVLSLPNGVFIGERTFGGNGTLSANNDCFEERYDGYFKNNAMMAYTTNTAMTDLAGNSYEGVGVPPTIEVPYNAEQFALGVDTQLERAVSYIHAWK